MSNLKKHAERELQIVGYREDSEDALDRAIYLSTMIIVGAFSGCGHSGGSAEAHTQMIERLLRFKALTPISNNPAEWEDGAAMYAPTSEDTTLWQNRRDSRMFSEDGGLTYYNVDEYRRGWKRKLFGLRGKTYRAIESKELKA